MCGSADTTSPRVRYGARSTTTRASGRRPSRSTPAACSPRARRRPVAETAPVTGGGTSTVVGGSSGGVGPADIWNELTQAGANAVQAAGLMGNAIAESGLNVESKAMDSNGAYSYGLFQWNTASYPGASSLVTGNPAKDLSAQVSFLAQTGGFKAATGTTPAQVASNFAA